MQSSDTMEFSARAEKYVLRDECDSADSKGDDDEIAVGLLGNKWQRERSVQHRKPASILWIVLFATICSGALIYISVTVHNVQRAVHLHPTGQELGDCGANHSVEEARAKGCIFDPMSWLWVRPECYDKTLIDDFMNRTDWSWHTKWTLDAESKVPLDEVFAGDHPQLFTSKKYHSIHCTYMWQKMHKALLEHGPVDSDLTNWHHTHHCEQVLLDQYLHEDSDCTSDMICPTLVRATWTSCGYF